VEKLHFTDAMKERSYQQRLVTVVGFRFDRRSAYSIFDLFNLFFLIKTVFFSYNNLVGKIFLAYFSPVNGALACGVENPNGA